MNSSFKQVHSNLDSCANFRLMANEIRDLALKAGVRVTPYTSEDLPHFSVLSPKKQARVLQILAHQREFFEMAESERISMRSPQLIWRALAKMRMIPQPDLFEKITADDTVEIFHWDSSSSFKNLVFFEYISMSLEEIYCLTWMEQVTISSRMTMFFLEMNAKLRIARYDHTFAPRFGKYVIEERLGEKRKFDIHLKWISPLRFEGEKKALIFVNRSSFHKDSKT